MKVLHLAFHPDMGKSRVNKIWAAAARAAGFTMRELYPLYPDFRINAAAEQALIEAHDRIVLQFPFYWYSTPPLLKQWLDDVLAFGFAYGPGTLKTEGKEMLLCVTVGGPADAYLPGGYNNFTVPELLRPLQQTAFLCKMKYLTPFYMHGSVKATDAEIAAGAERMVAHIRNESLSDIWSAQKRIFKEMGVA